MNNPKNQTGIKPQTTSTLPIAINALTTNFAIRLPSSMVTTAPLVAGSLVCRLGAFVFVPIPVPLPDGGAEAAVAAIVPVADDVPFILVGIVDIEVVAVVLNTAVEFVLVVAVPFPV